MIKRITLLSVLICLTFSVAFAQDVNDKENLVKNAELENYAGKLKKLGKFYMVEDWDSYTLARPDYFEKGAEMPEIGIPSNVILPSAIPPESIRIKDKPSVLLPHALSPAIPMDSPSLSSKSTSSTA